jgi:hypothetical protein
MTATVVPFRSSGSCARHKKSPHALPVAKLTGDYEPRTTVPDHHSLSLGQGPLKGHPLPSQAEILRQTHQHLADCWALRAESRRIQRDYIDRQRRIEVLLAGIDVERA